MTFKIKQTARSTEIIDARFRQIAADLRNARPVVVQLFAKRRPAPRALAA